MTKNAQVLKDTKLQIQKATYLLSGIDLRTLRSDPERREAIQQARANLREAELWLAHTS